MCRVHTRDDTDDVFFDVAMWQYAGMDMSDITDLLSSRRETPSEYEVDLDEIETVDFITEQMERLISEEEEDEEEEEEEETVENTCMDLIDELENRADDVEEDVQDNELNIVRTECYEYNNDYIIPYDYAYTSFIKFELNSSTRSAIATQTEYGFMSGIDFQVMSFLTEFRKQSDNTKDSVDTFDK